MATKAKARNWGVVIIAVAIDVMSVTFAVAMDVMFGTVAVAMDARCVTFAGARM